MIRLAPFSLSLSSPLGTAKGTIRSREGVLVGVERDGSRGVGEATPLPGWTESVEECRRALEAVADRDPVGALDALGDAPAARHGLALALADARARSDGVPLAVHLAAGPSATAAPPADGVPVNATVGDGDVAETVAAAESAVSDGFDCLKVKVGSAGLARDVERLRAVREAVGGDVALRADANGAWDRETAAKAVETLAYLDLAYLEQPLPAGDLDGHAVLRSRGVPIAVDESLRVADAATVLGAGAADVLVLKPMVLGGPARTLAAARAARSSGADAVVTTTVDGAVARTGAVHAAAAIPDVRPCGLATGALLAEDFEPDPAPIADGRARVPSGTGLADGRFDHLVFGR